MMTLVSNSTGPMCRARGLDLDKPFEAVRGEQFREPFDLPERDGAIGTVSIPGRRRAPA